MKLDLTDPMVRDMADRDHVPTELWTRDRVGFNRHLESVVCEECAQPWPCATRAELRELGAL